ncbi:MAG TPA: exonuclease SbcCD subunit D [Bacillales bacterium]|nr:exonuclease SbcCD subunit D [Bacillales bacterium]
MRILHTADWHLGRTLEGRSRQREQEQFIDELCDLAEDERVDAVLMAGDAFDSVNPPAVSEQLFYEAMSRLSNSGKRPIVAVSGNHDNPDRLSASSPLASGQGITLIGRPTSDLVEIETPNGESLRLAALPYPSESRLNEVLSQSGGEELLQEAYNNRIKGLFDKLAKGFQKDAVNLAISHLFVAGGEETESERPIQIGGAYTVHSNALPESAQYVALGHLHRPQNIKGAHMPIRYSGSPLAYSFSEAGQAKSVTIAELSPGKPADVNEIVLSCGKPLVRWKAREGIQQVYQWLDEGKDENAWIDLEIHLTDALSLEEIHRLRKRHPGFIHIRPQFADAPGDDQGVVRESMPIDELFRRFYQRQTGGGVPNERLTELFLEIAGESSETNEE